MEAPDARGVLVVQAQELVLRLTRDELAWATVHGDLAGWWAAVERALAAAAPVAAERQDRLVLPLDPPRRIEGDRWSLGLGPAMRALAQAGAVGVPRALIPRAAGEALALAAARWCLAAGADPDWVAPASGGQACPPEVARRLGRSAKRDGAAGGGHRYEDGDRPRARAAEQ